MEDCCQKKSCELEQLNRRQAKVLWVVLVINATMFVVEFGGGIISRSIALSGDSLDMLGDAIVYGSSLYVINMGRRAQAASATLKGVIMIGSAAVVLAQAIYRMYVQSTPEVSLMSGITLLALMANAVCLALLTQFKNDDLNMSSVWLCSRNDLIANSSVLVAACLVWWTGAFWPDIIVGLGITVLFMRSGLKVLGQARKELQPMTRG